MLWPRAMNLLQVGVRGRPCSAPIRIRFAVQGLGVINSGRFGSHHGPRFCTQKFVAAVVALSSASQPVDNSDTPYSLRFLRLLMRGTRGCSFAMLQPRYLHVTRRAMSQSNLFSAFLRHSEVQSTLSAPRLSKRLPKQCNVPPRTLNPSESPKPQAQTSNPDKTKEAKGLRLQV